MSLLRRSFVMALCLMVIAGLIAILSFNVIAAGVAWPGLIVVNSVYSRFGVYVHDLPAWNWLVPGLLIDLVFYTFLFFGPAKVWRMWAARPIRQQCEPELPVSLTTNDQRPTTPL